MNIYEQIKQDLYWGADQADLCCTHWCAAIRSLLPSLDQQTDNCLNAYRLTPSLFVSGTSQCLRCPDHIPLAVIELLNPPPFLCEHSGQTQRTTQRLSFKPPAAEPLCYLRHGVRLASPAWETHPGLLRVRGHCESLLLSWTTQRFSADRTRRIFYPALCHCVSTNAAPFWFSLLVPRIDDNQGSTRDWVHTRCLR